MGSASAVAEPRFQIATWRLADGEELRLQLLEFNGHRRCDLRLYTAKLGSEGPQPSRQGVVVGLDRLGQLIQALQRARRQAAALRWLDDAVSADDPTASREHEF